MGEKSGKPKSVVWDEMKLDQTTEKEKKKKKQEKFK